MPVPISILDSVRGFVPVAGPIQVQHFTGAAVDTLTQGTIVKLSSGTVTPVIATGGGQIGVLMSDCASGGDALVNIDPDTIYEADSNGVAFGVTDIGKIFTVTATTATVSTGARSTQKVAVASGILPLGASAGSGGAATFTVDFVVVCVGLPKVVTNVAAASNLKGYFKIISSKLTPTMDLIV